MDHRTLEKYLKSGNPYLYRFVFSLKPISTMSVDALLTLSDMQLLFDQTREDINNAELQPKSNRILAENIKNPNLTAQYVSLNICAKALKGDRKTIRDYLNGKSNKLYYRGQ